MISQTLLRQVGELERSAQVELIDFLYREIDGETLDDSTRAILDERIADLEANPSEGRPMAETLADLRAKWR
ncbi:MAG: addiction module protein [Propionibacteriaceae bacterium]|jgi:hypothetical protein|nr:addiction module protein [Propionibacteriaceae bacterium]